MNIFVTKGKKENIDISFNKPIDINLLKTAGFSNDILKKIANEKGSMYCWAFTESSNIKGYLKEAEKGGIFLIGQNKKTKDKNAGKMLYVANILAMEDNDYLNNMLWDKNKKTQQSNKWNKILFLKDLKKIQGNITCDEFVKSINNPKLTLQTLYQLKDYEVELFFNAYKGIYNELGMPRKARIDEVAVGEVEKKKININKLIESSIIDAEFNFNKVDKKSNSSHKKEDSKKRNFNDEKETKLSSYEKKIIGYIGERNAYNSIVKNINYILNIINCNEDIKELLWYNKDVDVNNENWEDQSVGKGYDIEGVTDNSRLGFEVKCMYENSNIITLTKNELYKMKEFHDKKGYYYFIILVMNLKKIELEEKPEIIILNNFSEMISYELIEITKTITMYVNGVIEKYKLAKE